MLLKKFIICILIVLSIFSLCACNIAETNIENTINTISTDSISTTNNGTANIDATNQKEETDTTNDNDIIPVTEEHYVLSYYSFDGVRRAETETRIYYLGTTFTYKNKLNNESYKLCFDPLCDHQGNYCPSVLFRGERGIYSKLDNRIYISRGDCIFSMNFNANDIALEIEFSKYGTDITKYLTQQTQTEYDASIIGHILIHGVYDEYIFFSKSIVPDDYKLDEFNQINTYGYALYRYNIRTKELLELSKATSNMSIVALCISEYGKLYFLSNGEDGLVFYSSDLDFNGIKKYDFIPLHNKITVNTNKGLYFTETDEYKETNLGSVSSKAHLCYLDFSNDELIALTEPLDVTARKIQILYIDDQYIFYTPCNSLKISSYKDHSGRDTELSVLYHDVYMSTVDGKNTQKVFEGILSEDPREPAYDIYDLIKEGDDYVFLAMVRQDLGDETYKAVGTKARIVVRQDENNNFVIVSIEHFK